MQAEEQNKCSTHVSFLCLLLPVSGLAHMCMAFLLHGLYPGVSPLLTV